MVDLTKRRQGWYWCRIIDGGPGEIALWWRGEWNRVGFTKAYSDDFWFEVGGYLGCSFKKEDLEKSTYD